MKTVMLPMSDEDYEAVEWLANVTGKEDAEDYLGEVVRYVITEQVQALCEGEGCWCRDDEIPF